MLRYFLLIFLLSFSANAAELNLSKENYSHFSNKEYIADILSDLSIDSNIRVNVSPNVNVYISGYFEDTTANDLFNKIISDNNLIWYYDDVVLYVYNKSDIKQKIIRLYNITPEYFKDKLIEMSVYDDKFDWKINNNLLTVFGPPRYIEIIDEMLSMIDNQSEVGVKVFPLKHARADDHSISTKNGTLKVDGIASLLKKLIVGEDYPTFFESDDKGSYRDALAKMKSISRNDDKFTPQITADIRTNGIIVHDYVNKFPIYNRLIDILDIEMPLIEIAITIVDLSIEQSRTIGTEWDARFDLNNNNSNGDVSVNFVGGSNFNSVLQASIATEFFLKEFLQKIKLMEKSGNGKIISRPTILTTNNLKAVLDHSKTFHIRAGSKDNNDLVSAINVGLNLQVTPRIIEKDDSRMVYMDINISDGNIIGDNNVDSIPLTGQTNIVSQATVKEGNSVIIGGYYYEKKGTSIKKIPILGDIPILGYLFKQKDKSYMTVERIFIITPKIIGNNQVIDVSNDVLDHVNSGSKSKNIIKNTVSHAEDRKDYLTKVNNGHLGIGLDQVFSNVILSEIDNSVFNFYDNCKKKYEPAFCLKNIRKRYAIDSKILLLNKEINHIKKKVRLLMNKYISCTKSIKNSDLCIQKVKDSSMIKDIDNFCQMRIGVDGYGKIMSLINEFNICRNSGANIKFCYNNVFKLIDNDEDFQIVVFPDLKNIKEKLYARKS